MITSATVDAAIEAFLEETAGLDRADLILRLRALPKSSLVVCLRAIEERESRGQEDRIRESIEHDKALCEASFYYFFRRAWEVIDGGPFVDNWHIRAMCEHLQHLAEFGPGDRLFDNLLINVPPGCSKTKLVSVAWPAWVWTRRPTAKFFCASYEQERANEDSVACRDLISSDWYRARWSDRVELKRDQRAKKRFDLVGGGWRLSSTPRGRGTGAHPDFIVIDDPLSAEQAESEKDRAKVRRWYSKTLPTRGAGKGAAMVLIMQRLHHEDLTGHVLKTEPDLWCRIILPMRFEFGRMEATPLGWNDERTESGALLWPELFPEAKVVRLEQRLQTAVAGQLQQRPPDRPADAEWPQSYFEGDDLWFDFWPPAEKVLFRIVTLDPSKGKNERSDFSAIIKMAVCEFDELYVDAVIDRFPIAELVPTFFAECDGFAPTLIGIETNSFQQLLKIEFERYSQEHGLLLGRIFELENYRPPKEVRIKRLSGLLARRQIKFRNGSAGAKRLVQQLSGFPGHPNDDGPDALEMAQRLALMEYSQEFMQ